MVTRPSRLLDRLLTRRSSRRAFLQRAGLLMALGLVLLSVWPFPRRAARRLWKDLAREPHDAAARRVPPRPLKPAELGAILALAEVVVPWSEGREIVRTVTAEHVSGRAEREPGIVGRYAAAAAWLDRSAREQWHAASFAALELSRRHQWLLAQTGGSFSRVHLPRRLLFKDRDLAMAHVRFLAQDVLAHFYSTEAAQWYLSAMAGS